MTGVYESTKPPTLVNDPDCLRVEDGALVSTKSSTPCSGSSWFKRRENGLTGRRRWVRGRDPCHRLPSTFTSAHRHPRSV